MDPAKIFAEALSLKASFLIAALLCANAAIGVQAVRGYLLLTPPCSQERTHVPFFSYVRVYYIAICIANLTPGRVGLLAQIPLLRRLGMTMGNSAVNTLLDKFYDLAAFCILAAASSLVLATGVVNKPLLFAAVAVSLFITLYLDSLIVFSLSFIARFGQKAASLAERIVISPILIRAKILATGMTLVRVSLSVGMHYFLALSLHLTLPFSSIVAATALGALSAILPFTVMGAGARDLIFLALFAASSASDAQILAFSSLVLASYLSVNILGGIIWVYTSIKCKKDNTV
jgi:uncharacterized membrane protein YbhN (UPF0104 family)